MNLQGFFPFYSKHWNSLQLIWQLVFWTILTIWIPKNKHVGKHATSVSQALGAILQTSQV